MRYELQFLADPPYVLPYLLIVRQKQMLLGLCNRVLGYMFDCGVQATDVQLIPDRLLPIVICERIVKELGASGA